MKLVELRRLGIPRTVFDCALERGFDCPTGARVFLSELTATDLLRDEPSEWELLSAVLSNESESEG